MFHREFQSHMFWLHVAMKQTKGFGIFRIQMNIKYQVSTPSNLAVDIWSQVIIGRPSSSVQMLMTIELCHIVICDMTCQKLTILLGKKDFTVDLLPFGAIVILPNCQCQLQKD